MEPATRLFTDTPMDRLSFSRRRYDLGYLVVDTKDTGSPKAERGKSLSEMKRFVLQGGNASEIFVLDKHSRRMYYDTNGSLSYVLAASSIVDLKQADVTQFVAMLEKADIQNWKADYEGSPVSNWVIAIEYADGSIEQHRGFMPPPEEFMPLYTYLQDLAETFPLRMRKERKATTNIDYLATTFDRSLISPIRFEGVERVLIFEASGPHEVLNHSEHTQKTMLLDILNQTLYYEPWKAVYEDISEASLQQELSDDFKNQVLKILKNNNVDKWQVNMPYRGKLHNPIYFLGDIPAWMVALQYESGAVAHFFGDGIGPGGWAKQSGALLSEIWSLPLEKAPAQSFALRAAVS